MGGFPILSAVVFLPLIGALIIMGVRSATAGSFSSEEAGKDSRAALLAGLIISSATFVASVAAFLTFRCQCRRVSARRAICLVREYHLQGGH